jgi:hypothetical protein
MTPTILRDEFLEEGRREEMRGILTLILCSHEDFLESFLGRCGVGKLNHYGQKG